MEPSLRSIPVFICFRYGYTNFGYVSSLISGVGIFCVGAGFSWYHGIAGIITKSELVDMPWVRNHHPGILPMSGQLLVFLCLKQAIALLGVSFASESVTLLMAIRNIKRKAKQASVSAYDYGE